MGNKNGGSKGFVTGAFIGGLVGALTAVLLSPKSGRDLRDDLSKQVQTTGDRSGDWLTIAKQSSQTLAKSVGEQSSNILGKVRTWRSKQQLRDEESTDVEPFHGEEPEQRIEIPKDYYTNGDEAKGQSQL